MPCLHANCSEASGHFNGVNEDELCTICYTTELGSEACTRLSCGHVFHTNCLIQLLQHRWPTLRMTFGFMACPSCNQEIQPKGLPRQVLKELGPLLSLKKQVEKDALKNAKEQGLLNDERISDPASDYYQKPQEFANHRCSHYLCHGCKKPYFGGLIDCEQEAANAQQHNTKKEDLLCQDCLVIDIGEGKDNCEIHGKQQIDWKCMYCCNVALFCCFGTHYMCNPCHDEYNRTSNPKLKDCGGVNCPLGIPHPPASSDPKKGRFPLGCGICRSEKIAKHKDGKLANEHHNCHKEPSKEIKIDRPEIEIEFPELIL